MNVWLNGAILALDDARIAPNDRGFTLGDGLFETFAVRAGRPLRLPSHLARLAHGCDVIGLPMVAPSTVETALADLLAADALSDAVVRLTYTRGPAPRGVAPPDDPTPTLLLTAAPMPPPPKPVRLHVARATRRNEHSPLCACKHLNYLDNVIAAAEAKAHGADDALLLNTRGAIVETTVANLFAVIDGTLFTPPLTDGCLPGTAREIVLRSTAAVERSLSEADLARATELFVTSTLGARPVIALDGAPLAPGPAHENIRTILNQ